MRHAHPLATLLLVGALAVPGLGAAQTREPLARVDGEAITAAEVEAALGPQLHRLEEQMSRFKRQKVEALECPHGKGAQPTLI